ncbi:MAG: hypothetical protein EBV72_13355, partial [Betaproteobacteria bacterium]|nr:hypothetical protein [Betaproteobacteria bacterium]
MEASAMGADGSTCCLGALNQWMGNTNRISSAYRFLCACRRQRDSSGTQLDCLVVVLFANRAVDRWGDA